MHAERQKHLRKMPDALAKAGVPVRFRVKTIDGRPAIETTFEKVVEHRGETFKIRGRLDGILEFFDENGEIIGEAVWDLKTKTLKKKLKQIEREVEKYKLQMACYRVLTDIPFAILEFESAQKDWSKDGPNEDMAHELLELTDDLVKQVLDKFAYVTACVRTGTVPEMERDEYYCANLCTRSRACHRHNLDTIGGVA